ncbi:hypothetical protein DVH24_027987 [Malus domestica]|uniref:Uncharacterized protein n=1 Tax=Malus domestica TaxID=3750 RepID=A0A498HAI6_MALDO|nr:hypothetical protein DVH24_027987 [Malus domestica]
MCPCQENDLEQLTQTSDQISHFLILVSVDLYGSDYRKYCHWMRTLTSKLQICSKKPRSVNIKCISHWQRNKAKQFWFAFVLYSLKSLNDKNSDNSQKSFGDNGFSLFQILRAAKLKYFVVKAGSILRNIYGEDWENKLDAKELQANFVCLSLLSK